MPTEFKRAGRQRPPGQADYDSLVRSVQGQVAKICDKLAKGSIDADRWYALMDAALFEGHAEARVLGRQLAGDLSARGETDDLAARAAMDIQDGFLLSFRDQLADQSSALHDEDGKLRDAALRARANLYTMATRGTAAEAFVDAGDDDEEYIWNLGAVEEHCKDCPEIAALSPFTKETLFAYPGDGSTPCLGNCECHLSRKSDGRRCFSKPGSGGSPPAGTPPADSTTEGDAEEDDHLADSFIATGSAAQALHQRAFNAMREVFQMQAPFKKPYDFELEANVHGAEGFIEPKARLVRISSSSLYPTTTVFHEVGHAIDFDVFGGRKTMASHMVASGQASPLEDWWVAITSSTSVRQLIGILSHPALTIDEDRYFRYLLDPAELWARSFAQYVSERQTNKDIAKEWADELAKLQQVGLQSSQWSAQDFAPIARAIEAILKDKGWIKAIRLVVERLWMSCAN